MSSKIKSPAEILELAIGYQQSQVLFTLVELEIPKILYKENLNAEKLAKKLRIHPLAISAELRRMNPELFSQFFGVKIFFVKNFRYF